ncbi:RTA1 domain protein [Microdochium bolleyi]|uniref:RTA1 domain protein n=1 Tax=Microdochium bolleyi TaxID=196109 RepID=A0A136IM97_9PEZI|nr:RTA1 domain protein [Microdochium bolleyi]
MAQLEPLSGGYYLWTYVPSIPAAVIAAIVFALLTLAYAWRLCQTRTWFTLPMLIGGLMEVVGFSARVVCHSNTGKLVPYIIQNMFILLPPVLFAASIYMILGRVIRSVHGEPYSIVRTKWLTKAFLAGDFLSFAVQGNAAALTATGSNAVLGQWIVVTGLFIQIAVFGFFVVVAAVFHYRYQKYRASPVDRAKSGWKKIMAMLYAVSALIMIRSLFRVVEYVLGPHGYPLMNEWTLYVFDASLMVIVMLVYYVYWPSNIVRENDGHQQIGLYSTRERDSTKGFATV